MSSPPGSPRGGGGGRPHKRSRRGRKSGDTVEDYHKNQAAREAERNAEQKRRAQEISKLLKDDKAIKEEIERLKQDTEKDRTSTIRALETTLARHQTEAERRLQKQELDSELAVKRRLAAGVSVGPAPPPGDPPRRGPGCPPPRPPSDWLDLPQPRAPPLPSTSALAPPPLQVAPAPVPQAIPQPVIAAVEQTQQQPPMPQAQPKKPLFMPTSVAVNIKRKD